MQIKKASRDARYPESSGFEEEYEVRPQAASTGERPPEAFSVRPVKPTQQTENAVSEQPDRPAPANRSVSVIDRHSSFDGRFETDHDLRVEGTISGEVVCRGLMTIEREATTRAKVQTRDAHIQGRFEGDLVCSGKLQLASTAQVTGTLKAAVLVVEEGASLSGSVETAQAQGGQRAAAANGNGVAAASEPENGSREPGTVTRPRRDLPSFAIVASDDRVASDRN